MTTATVERTEHYGTVCAWSPNLHHAVCDCGHELIRATSDAAAAAIEAHIERSTGRHVPAEILTTTTHEGA